MSLLLLQLMPLLAPATCDEASDVVNVKVSVLVILASEAGSDVDKHLEAIAKEVQKHSPHLKSFKTRGYESQALAHGEKGIFKLVDQRTASVMVKRPPEGSSRADLAVVAPGQTQRVYSCAYDQFFHVMTGHRTSAGERLILAVRVNCVQGER